MAPRFDLIGPTAPDMARSLDFYRRFGLDIPPGAESEPHVEVTPRGVLLAQDAIGTIRSFGPD